MGLGYVELFLDCRSCDLSMQAACSPFPLQVPSMYEQHAEPNTYPAAQGFLRAAPERQKGYYKGLNN